MSPMNIKTLLFMPASSHACCILQQNRSSESLVNILTLSMMKTSEERMLSKEGDEDVIGRTLDSSRSVPEVDRHIVLKSTGCVELVGSAGNIGATHITFLSLLD
jgi:hypothetical protein